MIDLEKIKCLGHSTIRIIDQERIIYIDPYSIDKKEQDADIIFITHNHYDHFSEEDILKIKNDQTVIIITEDLYLKTRELGFTDQYIIKVKPNYQYQVLDICFSTIPSYNMNKEFHLKSHNWVGYIIEIGGLKYYVAGDTDITLENQLIKCDVAFLPIGGRFTMDFMEAARLANIIKPKVVIPIHYGLIIGTKEDALKFKENINQNIDCIIMY